MNEVYFIAEKGPGGINGDTFLCQACNERLGTYDPGDDDVEVWELGGIGWTRTIRCRVCNAVVASKDPQAGKDART